MQGLVQDVQLTLDKFLSHAARWNGGREVVTRTPSGAMHRSGYGEIHRRARKVSNALLAMGIGKSDRIGTLGWNSHRHLETWYGVIGIGAICHTINPRLFEEQVAYIINHAQDRVIIADPACAPLLEKVLPKCPGVEAVIFLCDAGERPKTTFRSIDFESWIDPHGEECAWGGYEEGLAATLCYTSGTVGDPKGVLYSHRGCYIQTLLTLQPDILGLSGSDNILLLVPMYHANAWNIVYSAPAVGARLVLPGQQMDPATIHELLETEGITYSSGVPTLWKMLVDHLKATNGKLSTLKRVTIGGSACPESLARTLYDNYGVEVTSGWGMTEAGPVSSMTQLPAYLAALPYDEQIPYRVTQGRLICSLDVKFTDDEGKAVPSDGRSVGNLRIKGPTIASSYYRNSSSPLDDDGYLDTGDVVTIDGDGFINIVDRAKDVIKSGGEWISSVEIENLAVGQPGVELAAVIGVPHPKWDERPILLLKPLSGATPDTAGIRDFLLTRISKWWMPDDILVVEDIPLTATGKIDKKRIRQQMADYSLPA